MCIIGNKPPYEVRSGFPSDERSVDEIHRWAMACFMNTHRKAVPRTTYRKPFPLHHDEPEGARTGINSCPPRTLRRR
jgi:hypothetical protein